LFVFVNIIFAYLLFIYLTYSLLLLILHQERGDRLCVGSEENGREEQPRMGGALRKNLRYANF